MPHLLAEDPSKPLAQAHLPFRKQRANPSGQASTSAVEKPEDSPTIDKKKDSKRVTGGLFKEWFSRAQVSKTEEPPGGNVQPSAKRKPRLWEWFNPKAPLSEAEQSRKPIDSLGRRITPQQMGSSPVTEAEGIEWFSFGFNAFAKIQTCNLYCIPETRRKKVAPPRKVLRYGQLGQGP